MRTLFPVNVHEIDVKNFKIIKDDVIKFIYQERKKSDGVQRSNQGGWQSLPTYADSDNILADTVRESLDSYFATTPIFKEKVKIRINSLWININKKNDSNVEHLHPASHLSGVWWIKIPKNSGALWFSSPHWFNQYHEIFCYSDSYKENTNTYLNYYLDPREGGMVIFPSSLSHSVGVSETNEDRISVSFNIDLDVSSL